MNSLKSLMCLLVLALGLLACGDSEEEVQEVVTVKVVTGDASDCSLTSAALQGMISSASSKMDNIEVGIAYCLENSQEAMTYVKATDIEYMAGHRSFYVTPVGLQPDATYIYCAYSKDARGNITDVGVQRTFRTLSPVVALSSSTMRYVAIHDATLCWTIASEKIYSELTDKELNASFSLAWSTDEEAIENQSANTQSFVFNQEQTVLLKIGSLKASTKYFYSTYIHLNGKQYTSPVNSFTTLSEQVFAGTAPSSVRVVDLGLPSGTKWANINVGAEKAEDTGLFFAWGETEGFVADGSDDHLFGWATYKWCKGSRSSQTKYCTTDSYGVVDNRVVLDFTDDAAYVNWGDEWRMPTAEEMKELMENTTSEWTTVGGVDGYRFISNTKGNSIFLPANGCRVSESNYENGTDCYYWTSSVDRESPYASRYLRFYVGRVFLASLFRYYGMNVRPVYRE